MFWTNHSPCTKSRNQYMSAIFYHGTKQKIMAEESRDTLQKEIARPIQTKILPASVFYNAENYHQKYMLRQHAEVLDKLNLSDEDILTSHVAARLNGYLGGFGSLEQFDQECNTFGLLENQLSFVRKQIQKRQKN
ncbi:peptide methionine sulfoxide reductase-like [Ylistrum balloti]|uniref:peptide methionine sulfoxide reductase-like n=1 Tax=Ylistrum balloti TaxID=509963 RepID=UPI002905AD56|nr:peptide methionine sulfoxide reductase-like [Ylistrum balloti]